MALQQAAEGAIQEDERMMLLAFREMQSTLVDITRLFHRMPEHCDPDVYYQQFRPYLFSFTDVVYEGVPTLEGPQSWRGGSGAQSSIIPAALAGLGVDHEQNTLTSHLNTMRDYMPVPHQQFIVDMGRARIRQAAVHSLTLRDEYNNTLRRLITFRRAHLYYARTFIFAKSTNPVGTGGTDFMHFLSQLIDETEHQLL
jgi:indoleamine 2,3-dioxygenase